MANHENCGYSPGEKSLFGQDSGNVFPDLFVAKGELLAVEEGIRES